MCKLGYRYAEFVSLYSLSLSVSALSIPDEIFCLGSIFKKDHLINAI